MPPDPPRGYRLRRAFIRTPLRQILDPPQKPVEFSSPRSVRNPNFKSEAHEHDLFYKHLKKLNLSLRSFEKQQLFKSAALEHDLFYIHLKKIELEPAFF